MIADPRSEPATESRNECLPQLTCGSLPQRSGDNQDELRLSTDNSVYVGYPLNEFFRAMKAGEVSRSVIMFQFSRPLTLLPETFACMSISTGRES